MPLVQAHAVKIQVVNALAIPDEKLVNDYVESVDTPVSAVDIYCECNMAYCDCNGSKMMTSSEVIALKIKPLAVYVSEKSQACTKFVGTQLSPVKMTCYWIQGVHKLGGVAGITNQHGDFVKLAADIAISALNVLENTPRIFTFLADRVVAGCDSYIF